MIRDYENPLLNKITGQLISIPEPDHDGAPGPDNEQELLQVSSPVESPTPSPQPAPQPTPKTSLGAEGAGQNGSLKNPVPGGKGVFKIAGFNGYLVLVVFALIIVIFTQKN